MNRRRVLIETSWNVKFDRYRPLLLLLSRINRNIVECKVWKKISNHDDVSCINRNIVECKDFRAGGLHSGNTCINRNIVECKARLPAHLLRAVRSINRNIVECKAAQSMKEFSKEIVLIETSWNVKFARASVST